MSTEFKVKTKESKGSLRIVKGYREGGILLTITGDAKTEVPLEANQIVATGRFEGRFEETDKDTGDIYVEYKIREENQDLVILKACASLNDAETGLASVAKGDLVQVVFLGMKKTKKNRNMANFSVATA